MLFFLLINIYKMAEIITTALLFFTSFFTLINPLGVMPVFMTMTASISEKERNKTARKAVIIAFFTLLAFSFTGQLLFNFFGISVDSFRVVGGIIFFIVGYDMLQARIGKTKIDESDIKSYVDDISITPLAIPMISGPGAITNGIVLWSDAHTIELKIILIASIFAIMLVTYMILYSSSKIINFLGETGNKVMMRLMGLIVMVIAVEFFFSGIKPIIQDILNIN